MAKQRTSQPDQDLTFWEKWQLLTLYEKFEQTVIFVLTILIALTIVFALWNLFITVTSEIWAKGLSFNPTDHRVFQSVFGMIFTVIIALEFKRSLLITVERRFSIVQVRAVILISILAMIRKFIIIDLEVIEADRLLALAASTLALGIVYWLAGDRSDREYKRMKEE